MGNLEKLLGWQKPETLGEKIVVSALHAMVMDDCMQADRAKAAREASLLKGAARRSARGKD